MGKKLLILGAVIIVLGYFIIQKYTYSPTPFKSQLSSAINKSTVPPSAKTQYLKPTIKVTSAINEKKLVEVVEYKLSVQIPVDWNQRIKEGTIIGISNAGKREIYSGSLILGDSDKKVEIEIVPNFQGDWLGCVNSKFKEENLPPRFGMYGEKISCGPAYYKYSASEDGKLKNLIIFVNNDSDPMVKGILSSIEYIPQ